MKSYVGAILIPFDFTLTPEQTNEVFETAQSALDAATDEDLFSDAIRRRLDQLIEPKINAWHEQLLEWVQEIRNAAPDHVTAFLLSEVSKEQLRQLKNRFAIEDPAALETELKSQIRTWLSGQDVEKLRQYDSVTVKELVFAELRSWC